MGDGCLRVYDPVKDLVVFEMGDVFDAIADTTLSYRQVCELGICRSYLDEILVMFRGNLVDRIKFGSLCDGVGCCQKKEGV